MTIVESLQKKFHRQLFKAKKISQHIIVAHYQMTLNMRCSRKFDGNAHDNAKLSYLRVCALLAD